jgi:hypothetical protein
MFPKVARSKDKKTIDIPLSKFKCVCCSFFILILLDCDGCNYATAHRQTIAEHCKNCPLSKKYQGSNWYVCTYCNHQGNKSLDITDLLKFKLDKDYRSIRDQLLARTLHGSNIERRKKKKKNVYCVMQK